jgi:hypothetical protein
MERNRTGVAPETHAGFPSATAEPMDSFFDQAAVRHRPTEYAPATLLSPLAEPAKANCAAIGGVRRADAMERRANPRRRNNRPTNRLHAPRPSTEKLSDA